MGTGDVIVGIAGAFLSGAAGGAATVSLTKRAEAKRAARIVMEPEAVVVPVAARDHDTAFPSLWIQFVVTNVGGGATAESVSVAVRSVRASSGQDVYVPASELKWSGTEKSTISVEHQARRNIDVAHVLWPPKPSVDGQEPWAPPWPFSADRRDKGALVLGVYPRPEHDSRIVLDPDIYTVELELCALSITAKRYFATIELRPLDDAWAHDEDPEALVGHPVSSTLPKDGSRALRVSGPQPVEAAGG